VLKSFSVKIQNPTLFSKPRALRKFFKFFSDFLFFRNSRSTYCLHNYNFFDFLDDFDCKYNNKNGKNFCEHILVNNIFKEFIKRQKREIIAGPDFCLKIFSKILVKQKFVTGRIFLFFKHSQKKFFFSKKIREKKGLVYFVLII